MCRHYVRGPSERLARHLRLTPPSVVVVVAVAVAAVARLGRTAARRAWRRGGLYPQLFRAGALHKKSRPEKEYPQAAVGSVARGPPLRWRHLSPGARRPRRDFRSTVMLPRHPRPRYAQNADAGTVLCRSNVRNSGPCQTTIANVRTWNTCVQLLFYTHTHTPQGSSSISRDNIL